MPRNCSVCGHPDQERIETALAEGASYRSVSRETRYSTLFEDSIRRHWLHHVAPEVRNARWSEGVSALSLSEKLAALTTEATIIRKRAVAAGDNRIALQAIRTEADLITRLVDRLGINPDKSEADLDEATALVRLIAQVAREHPQAALHMADMLPAEQRQLAERIRGVALGQTMEPKQIQP